MLTKTTSLRRQPLKRTPTARRNSLTVVQDVRKQEPGSDDDDIEAEPLGSPLTAAKKRRSIFTLRQRTFRSSLELSTLVADVPKPSVGLALSGGGMRSAMYCSGILRSVLEKDVRVDFLSSVSGGGYVASSYMEWKYRECGKDDLAWHKRYFDNLIAKAPNAFFRFDEGFVLGLCDFVFTSLAVLLNVTLLSLLATGSFLFPLASIVESLAGDWMRQRTTRELDYLIPGSQALQLSQMALVMLLIRIIRSLIPSSSRSHAVGHALWVVLTVIDSIASIVFVVYVIEGSNRMLQSLLANGAEKDSAGHEAIRSAGFTYLWTIVTIGRLAVYFVLSIFSCHRLPSFIFLVLTSYVVHMMVFASESEQEIIEEYARYAWLAFLFCPITQPVRDALFFHLYRHNMAYAFYHPRGKKSLSIMTLFDVYPYLVTKDESHMVNKQPGYEGELTVGDLCKTSPEWICQMTLNDWQPVSDEDDADDFKILTVSSKATDVIDFTVGDPGKYLQLKPQDIKVTTAMAASAAAFHVSMGRLSKAIEALRPVFLLVGISIGITIPSALDIPRNQREKLTRMVAVLSWPLLLMFTFWLVSGEYAPCNYVLLSQFLIFLYFATFPTGQDVLQRSRAHQLLYSISRWVNIHLRPALFFRELTNVKTVGKYPGFMLNVSDGGHIENLGLLPLLRRRANKIIIADGGLHQSPFDIASDLTYALQAARWSLGCHFTTMDDEDVEQAIIHEFIQPYSDTQPHCFKFKVHYMETTCDGQSKEVDQGEILIVQPRHPGNLATSDFSGDIEDGWGEEEANALTGILVRWMHGRFRSLFHSLVGVFPSFGTHWLVLTPQMVSALHEEGRRGMRAPVAEEFLSSLPRRRVDSDVVEDEKKEA